MLIDWFTVVAQLVNFLVLIWLLRRYLYRPVLRAMAAREARIAQEIATARQATLDAQAEQLRWQQKQEDWQRERDALLQQARVAAENERAAILVAAQQTAQQLQDMQHASLASELQRLQDTLKRQTCHEVLQIAQQLVSDLAQQDLQSAMLTVFWRRLRQMNAEEKQPWSTQQVGAQTWVFRSVFALDAVQQQQVQDLLKSTFPDLPVVHFEQTQDLLCGIELQVGTHRLAWNTRDYLHDFEARVLTLPAQTAALREQV